MNIGAVGYSTDFYRAGYRKNSSNDSASKFTTMGSATQETTSMEKQLVLQQQGIQDC